MIEAIRIIESGDNVFNDTLQLVTLKNHNYYNDEEGVVLIPEQFANIQKVAFDICKISEKIRIM
jgi:hypothetical protein